MTDPEPTPSDIEDVFLIGERQEREPEEEIQPESLLHAREVPGGGTRITATYYSPNRLVSEELAPAARRATVEPGVITWFHVEGLGNLAALETVCNSFGLHPLVLEDIQNTEQRPKVEDYGDYLYIVLKAYFYSEEERRVEGEQISIAFGSDFCVSFAERDTELFDSVRTRMTPAGARIRKLGPDYLAYVLLDLIVDGYFDLLELLGERIEDLEVELTAHPDQDTLRSLHTARREIVTLRTGIWPFREVVNALHRGESALVQESTEVYLMDLYDHTIQVMETLDSYRDTLTGMTDIYLSSQSNRMNEIMKVLTIISTIFMPLTFIAGVYGMNFRHMPELDSPVAYPIVIVVMLLIAVAMLAFFRRRRWL